MENALVVGLGFASLLDLAYRKIPNALTLTLIIAGFIFQFISFGFEGLFHGLLGLLTGTALLYLPFAVGGVGGGDVKLMASIGVFVGPAAALDIFLVSAVFGGLFSLMEAVRSRTLFKVFAGIRFRIQHLFAMQKPYQEDHEIASHHALHIPYAVSLSMGAVWVLSIGGILP